MKLKQVCLKTKAQIPPRSTSSKSSPPRNPGPHRQFLTTHPSRGANLGLSTPKPLPPSQHLACDTSQLCSSSGGNHSTSCTQGSDTASSLLQLIQAHLSLQTATRGISLCSLKVRIRELSSYLNQSFLLSHPYPLGCTTVSRCRGLGSAFL